MKWSIFQLKCLYYGLILFFQTIFGSDIRGMCDDCPVKLTVPPGYPNTFTYIVTKVSSGCEKALTAFYPPLMQVRTTE